MKKLITLLPLLLLLGVLKGNAQIFWVENFESGSSSGMVANTYTGPNGAWTLISTGTEDAQHNEWYVSCAEAGHITGGCGSACSSGDLGATLHMGSNDGLTTTDPGASYDAGGLCGGLGICVTTSRRAASPTINCTGKYGITLSFYYILDGQTTLDSGWVSYSADGTTWTALATGPTRTAHCGAQGKWAHFSIALPASANNNPNVKIGFDWKNNDDGVGTDPSFAVDSMALSTPGTTSTVHASFTTSSTTICQDSCITFTSTSTASGTVDSIRWSIPGVTISTPTATPMTACFTTPGTYIVHLYVHSGTMTDSTTTTVTVNPAPHPVVTLAGHTLTVTGTYTSYQWYKNGVAISGSTTSSYTFATPGSYQVIVDSGGCLGASDTSDWHLSVNNVANNQNNFSVNQSGGDAFTLYASDILDEKLTVNVYDATGRKIMESAWPEGTNKKQFTVNGLNSGIYFIRLSGGSTSAVLKWLKL